MVSKKDKTYEDMYGEEKAKLIKDKLSNSHKGQIAWNKGIKTGKQSAEHVKNRFSWAKNYKHSEETKRKIRESNIGKTRLNPVWNKGKGSGWVTGNGYKMITKNNKQILEHHDVWMKFNKKKILPGFHIHHNNGNKLDNRIENLTMLSISEHTKLHWARGDIRG